MWLAEVFVDRRREVIVDRQQLSVCSTDLMTSSLCVLIAVVCVNVFSLTFITWRSLMIDMSWCRLINVGGLARYDVMSLRRCCLSVQRTVCCLLCWQIEDAEQFPGQNRGLRAGQFLSVVSTARYLFDNWPSWVTSWGGSEVTPACLTVVHGDLTYVCLSVNYHNSHWL